MVGRRRLRAAGPTLRGTNMKIRVKLFAAAKQLAGAEAITVDVAEPTTVAAVREAMIQHNPPLKDVLRYATFAVNAEYVGTNAILPPDADVACIPPVSGG